MIDREQSLFEQVGGLPVLERVHKLFYDRVYAHEWLGQFFIGHDQSSIEMRQTLFMAEKMGGDVDYWGKQPEMAHRQFFITQELFDIRHEILHQALIEAGVDDDLIRRWLEIDNAFVRVVVKGSIESFYSNSFKFEKRIIVPRPKTTGN